MGRVCGIMSCWDHGRTRRFGGLVSGVDDFDYMLMYTLGMAWVAAGATRTLQTMAKSQFAFQLIPDLWELAGWTGELINTAWQYQVRLLLFSIANAHHPHRNPMDRCPTTPTCPTTFQTQPGRHYSPLPRIDSPYKQETNSGYTTRTRRLNGLRRRSQRTGRCRAW